MTALHTTASSNDRFATIHAYAADGIVCDYAIPTGTNTGHSFSSMLRSSYMEAIFDRNVPTMTQLLAGAGYHTSFINARRLDDWLTPRRCPSRRFAAWRASGARASP